MRLTLLYCMLIVLPSLVLSQEWEYRYSNGETNFPHEYTLMPDFGEPNELTIISQSKNEKTSIVSGTVIDYSNSKVWGVNVHLFDRQGNNISWTITDENGYFEINTELTSFKLKFSLIDNLKEAEFNIDKEQFTNTSLSIKMGRDQVLDFFVVFSKRQLTDSTLKKLIDCIKPLVYYESEKVYDCANDSKDYYISVRI